MHRLAIRSTFIAVTAALALAPGPWSEPGDAQAPAKAAPAPDYARGASLQLVARFPRRQITGIAVSPSGRIFVNLPRWTLDVPVSVAEVVDGTLRPYPSAAWNAWRNAAPLAPRDHFVCVQSVVFDRQGHLWVLDPGAPAMDKVVKNAAKLVEIDIATNAVMRTIVFPPGSAPRDSYLNDVRFSPRGDFAYMSDSGRGAIVVADVRRGTSWRVLDGDPSTQFDKTVVPAADGHPLRRPDGRTLQANSDGIALSPDGSTFYWQALDGKTLYSIATRTLRDRAAASTAAATVVEKTHPADGLWIDAAGMLYVTNPERNSVETGSPGGALRTLVADPRLRWPDTFAQGRGGLYVTSSHIQDSPFFKPAVRYTPSEIWRIVPR